MQNDPTTSISIPSHRRQTNEWNSGQWKIKQLLLGTTRVVLHSPCDFQEGLESWFNRQLKSVFQRRRQKQNSKTARPDRWTFPIYNSQLEAARHVTTRADSRVNELLTPYLYCSLPTNTPPPSCIQALAVLLVPQLR